MQPQTAAIKKAKRRKFVAAYIKTRNASEAARDAGYSPISAGVTASRLMEKPEIRAAIRAELDAACEMDIASGREVLRELTRVAFADLSDCVDERGQLLPLKSIPEAARRALATFEVEERPDGTTKVKTKLWDKVAALEKLGKFHKLFDDRPELAADLKITFVGIAPPALPGQAPAALPENADGATDAEFTEG